VTLIRLVACFALPAWLGLCSGAQPLTLRAKVEKPRTLVGETIRIYIEVAVSAALDMESVELNRDRTRVRVTPLSGGSARVFSGADYIRLHRFSGLIGIADRFHAAAGIAWTTQLDLQQYRRPLPAGRYRVEISYRYGETPETVARGNPVEVEVAPAQLLSAEYRWFGAPQARSELGSVWTARDGARVRWFFQTASPFDPTVVLSATEFAATAAPPASAPRLAHLNDSAAMHYDRIAVWLALDRLCWQPVHAAGLAAQPACFEHGLLESSVRMADPPLQRRSGGLSVVLTGRSSAGSAVAAIMDIAADGKVHQRTLSLSSVPEQAVVAWSPVADEHATSVYTVNRDRLARTDLATGEQQALFEGPGESDGFAIGQWLGLGTVFGIVREARSVRIIAIDLQSGERLPAATVIDQIPLATKLVQAAPFGGGSRYPAVLFRDQDKWLIVTDRDRSTVVVDGDESGAARLVASPGGLFLIGHAAGRGFLATRVRTVGTPSQ
jgi:hypothetical protein